MRKGIFYGLSKCLIVFAFLIFEILLVPPETISSPLSKGKQDQIKEIESKLSREKRKLKSFDFQEKDLLFQLADLEQKVKDVKRSINKLEEAIRLNQTEMEKLQESLTSLEKSLKNAETHVTKRLVALYKYARKGYIKVLANSKDLDQFWQRATYLRAIMEKDGIMLAELRKQTQLQEAEISRIGKKLIEREAERNENKTRLLSLKKELENQVIRLMNVHKEKEFYETAVKELQLAAQNLRQALVKIEKNDTHKILQSSSFADSKGKLPFPLKGKIIKADKLSGSNRKQLNKGIFIAGISDSTVKAIFPGRVDFSGRLKGYGEVVIINHGSRFFTISAHISTRKKKEGDVVEKGEVIGFLKHGGPSKEASLYFEIRKAGESLDPLKWLKAH
jgi:septal ring factor EnvC (AmiA/AmiB activator)